MRRREDPADCWPSARQELLLRAALLRGNEAIRAWNEWKSGVEIARLDTGSRRLLPQLYKNLDAQGVREPLVDELKGIYRYTRFQNRLLFRHIAGVIRFFQDSGIRTMLLKGAPLALLHYRDYGLRPMADVDVLVPVNVALKAVRLLKSSGWTPGKRFREADVLIRHAVGFRDAERRGFDLHWHLLPECCGPGADDDFWDGAVPIEIEGASTYTLNPADHLLHVCTHGLKWDRVPPLRWIADAVAIIGRSKSDLDWDRLAAQAQRLRLICPLREGLHYLRDKFDAPVPSRVLRQFRELPTSKMEELEHGFKIQDRRLKVLGQLPVIWFKYRRLGRRSRADDETIGLVKYLQRQWEVDNPSRLLVQAALKGMRCLGRILPRRASRSATMPERKR